MLDLSFNHATNTSFAIPLLLQMVYQIVALFKFEKTAECQREEMFNAFRLTKRGKEIAAAWHENKTVPEIAAKFSISERLIFSFSSLFKRNFRKNSATTPRWNTGNRSPLEMLVFYCLLVGV